MTSDQSRHVVRRYLAEVVNRLDHRAADALLADDIRFTSPYTPAPIASRAGLVTMLAGLHAAFPDFALIEAATVAEDGLVASRWTASGTHTGAPLAGAAASGRRFEITGMSIYRVAEGRIVEGWVNDDTFEFRRQLGLLAEWPHESAAA